MSLHGPFDSQSAEIDNTLTDGSGGFPQPLPTKHSYLKPDEWCFQATQYKTV